MGLVLDVGRMEGPFRRDLDNLLALWIQTRRKMRPRRVRPGGEPNSLGSWIRICSWLIWSITRESIPHDLFLGFFLFCLPLWYRTVILLSFSVASFSTDNRAAFMCNPSTDALLSQFLLNHTTANINLTLPNTNHSHVPTALGAARRHSVSSDQGASGTPPSRPVPYNPAIPPGMFHSMPASPVPSPPATSAGLGMGSTGGGSFNFPAVVETSGPACNLEKATDTCVAAARSVVDALTLIRATSFDISRLHPFVCVSPCFGHLAPLILTPLF